MSCTFDSNLAHLFAEVRRVELKLRLRAQLARSRDAYWSKTELRGLYISENEISDLIGSGVSTNLDASASNSPQFASQSLLDELNQLEKEIETRKVESLRQGIPLRLEKLADIFALTSFDKDVLLLCLLPELDVRHGRLFGYIQDDVTKMAPTVALALDLAGLSSEERLSARRAFLPEASLVKYSLLSLHDDTPRKSAPLLAKSLKIDDRICDYLLGLDDIDASLLSFVHTVVPQKTLNDIVLADDTKVHLARLTDSYPTNNCYPIWYFYGAPGAGKQSTAEALCHKLGTQLLVADVSQMLQVSLPFETAVHRFCREVMLQEAAAYWDNFDALFAEGLAMHLELAVSAIRGHPCPVFLAGSRPWGASCDWQERLFIPVEFPVPDYGQRRRLWRMHLNGQVKVSADVIDGLASKFGLTGGQICGAIEKARSLAVWRDSGAITADELYEACRQESNHKLHQLARKIEPRYVWDDIVLPADQMEQLRDICNYMKHRYLVYGEWGFQHKLSLGKGLNILFAGPSGTGKTMAAEIIANELGLDLYKIDLALVVSKYIGETEKNLDSIFKEAQNSNAILFFDEADAIFGKRSEVRDSHDRYANIEIAYLLQKMEEYPGVAVLATNLRKNIDEAFARRMHFSVEFPFPEEDDRYRIWQKAFPGAAPLSDDIDLMFMARQFRITGGNIKNIALGAAFLAAEGGGAITMRHLILATKREYQKMGKLCTEADFGRFYELIKN